MTHPAATPPTAEQVERAKRVIVALREPSAAFVRVPNTIRQSAAEAIDDLLAALAPAERALTRAEQQIFYDALRASTTQRSPGYRKAPAERASPVKHLNATGQFCERVKAWWVAKGTSEFKGATVGGDGYVNICWQDADESGNYSLRIDDLYSAPAERAEAVPERMFPILGGSPKSIPWSVIAPFDGQAKRNHSQDLERLAQRGGLGPEEALAVLTMVDYYKLPKMTRPEAVLRLTALVKERQTLAAAPTRAGALDAAGATEAERPEVEHG